MRLVAGGLGMTLALAFWQQGGSAAHAAEPAWTSPLAAPVFLVRPYLQPNSDYSAGHRGVDYRVSLGQILYSPAAAQVSFAGKVVNRPVVSLRTSAGEIVEFEPACPALPVGSNLQPGDQVATVCEADASYSQHCEKQRCLHYSLRTPLGYLSPLVRTNALAASVLLPRTGYSF